MSMLGQAVSEASPDLTRHLLGMMINAFLSADAGAVRGADYGQTSPERTKQRHGYQRRDRDTRVGTIDVAIRKFGTAPLPPLGRRKPPKQR